MAQRVQSPKTQDAEYTPMHIFKDSTSETDDGYDTYKVKVDSDEGRAFLKLKTDAERLNFMRQHAHEKMPVVYAKWYFYEDLAAGKEYNILIESPEGKEVEEVWEDSDAERDEEGEARLLAYFRTYAHKVMDLNPKHAVKAPDGYGNGSK